MPLFQKSVLKKHLKELGNNPELLKELIDQIKRINYKIDLVNLTCSIEEAKQRNANRDDDSISAYFCEPYHLEWFKQVLSESCISQKQ